MDEELELIDQLLSKYGGENSIFSASELDGFLTAIASGPKVVPHSVWYPAIWGEGHEPAWESPEEAERFLKLAITLMNQAIYALTEEPESYEALFMVDDEEKVIVEAWCFGYMNGADLAGWLEDEQDDELTELISVIALHCTEEGEKIVAGFTPEEYETSLDLIEASAIELHAYWLARREPLLPVRREEPKVGRNDPCPCGSGKKHKQCCMP
ncbi:UPF0149 family protein [Pseudomonas sp. LRF_L74]|uniref:UPF0149 family protein n=1 Tax=Pseudomonas sp. LRF_L74 TaxID=3369422 RepID=UPI003F5D9CEB